MPSVFEVRHLALVDAIAATGSVTRAAERLHLTQSALSHQLRQIETAFGAPFFLRVGRRMVLTPAGQRALASARRVLEDLDRAEQDLRAMASGDRGILRLCAECNTGYHWLPSLLSRFHRRHPGVDVQIDVAATHRPIPALLEGDLDLALVTSAIDDARIRLRPLFTDELVAVVAPDHPWARRATVRPDQFASAHLIVYAAERRDSFTFTRVLGPAGVEPARVSQLPLTEAIVEMVAAGLGVSVLPRWSIESAVRAGRVAAVPITRRRILRTWSAATLAATPEPAWLADFIALVAERALPARAGAPRRRRSRSTVDRR